MKVMKEYDFECAVCKKRTITMRSIKAPKPSYCSKNCYRSVSPNWLYRPAYNLKTEQEKADHIKEYYKRNVIKSEGCWDWIRKNKTDKYVRMHFGRKEPRISIHIYSWKINFGDIPKGMHVLHKCDNPRCSKPQHLFLGTAKDNAIDCKNKQRNAYGTKNKNAKLDDNKVREIKRLSTLNITMTKIAKDFNVSISTIERIINNKTWKHVY